MGSSNFERNIGLLKELITWYFILGDAILGEAFPPVKLFDIRTTTRFARPFVSTGWCRQWTQCQSCYDEWIHPGWLLCTDSDKCKSDQEAKRVCCVLDRAEEAEPELLGAAAAARKISSTFLCPSCPFSAYAGYVAAALCAHCYYSAQEPIVTAQRSALFYQRLDLWLICPQKTCAYLVTSHSGAQVSSNTVHPLLIFFFLN